MWGVFKKIVLFLALIVIAVLSLAPSEALPDTSISDKMAHFLAYGILSLMGLNACTGKAGRWWIVFGLVLYGISLEALQTLVPDRSFSIGDIFANTLGVFGGFAVWGTSARTATSTGYVNASTRFIQSTSAGR